MSFHANHRPATLSKIIGHESAVTRLRGMIASDTLPNAIAFFGPTSAGKTTLARAFAADVNGCPVTGSRDYVEYNAAESRTIDDVRSWIKNSRYKASVKKRIIVIDEAQGLLSNAPAANALLKPLEEPSKDTIWILCSMDPAKFATSKEGKAISNRCSQFVLEPHSAQDLLKQAKRIAKAERMSYVMDDENTLLKSVVRNCTEMRTLANLMESMKQYHAGLEKPKKMLTKEDISAVIQSTESADDAIAAQFLIALYTMQYKDAHRAVLDMKEGFTFVNTLLRLNAYVLGNAVVDGRKHPKLWSTHIGRQLAADAAKQKVTLGTYAAVGAALADVKAKVQQFALPIEDTLTAAAYNTIIALKVAQQSKAK